eukprot:6808058-Prymnesium_polylepis.1
MFGGASSGDGAAMFGGAAAMFGGGAAGIFGGGDSNTPLVMGVNGWDAAAPSGIDAEAARASAAAMHAAMLANSGA